MKPKIRAWYKHDNPPLKFEQETKEGEYCHLVYRSGEYEYPYSIEIIMCDDNWIVERFTGESDKNNKEVYEGDIVKYGLLYYDNSIQPCIGTVVFENCSFAIKNNAKNVNNCYLHQTIDYGEKLEIIGNIHDNPELLNVQ